MQSKTINRNDYTIDKNPLIVLVVHFGEAYACVVQRTGKPRNKLKDQAKNQSPINHLKKVSTILLKYIFFLYIFKIADGKIKKKLSRFCVGVNQNDRTQPLMD